MATTNLNLTTIAGTDNPANFPATYNENLGKIDANAGVSNVTFTPEAGITSSLSIRKCGKVVTVNGYVQASSNFPTTTTVLGTIASGSRPVDIARFPCEFATQAYNVGAIGYCNISSNGTINVKAPTANTYNFVYFTCSYIIA